MAVRVSAPARIHAGFVNVSLARDRVYGGVGAAIAEPRTTLTAEPADAVAVDGGTDRVERYVGRAVELLGVDGASVAVNSLIPPHVGLGSGTQLALAALAAVARAHGRDPRVRGRAPALGRGGRSGVGVATFEDGGLVVDAGHPTRRFTADPPETGDWRVPSVAARHDLPDDWRAVVAVPEDGEPIKGDDEDRRIRDAVLGTDPGPSEAVDAALVDRVLPGAAAGDLGAVAGGLETVDRVNGAWFADVQGGRYREAARPAVEALRDAPGVAGVCQSSWGPAVFGMATVDGADAAVDAVAHLDATVHVTAFDDAGATVE